MTETADKFTFKDSTHYYITWRQTVISGKYYSTNSKQKVLSVQTGLVQTLQLFLPYIVFQALPGR